MIKQAKSLRPFIGAVDFEVSRRFYTDLGFDETVLSEQLSVFKAGATAFYLQAAYVKDWVDNTMLFLEVENVPQFWQHLLSLNLPDKYPGARISPPRTLPWGSECFLHDPSGVLWHFGQFSATQQQ